MTQRLEHRLPLLLYVAFFALGFGWTMWLALNSPGTPLHDEITHYLIARDSWSQPEYLLNIWGRPGNTLFYLLPSAISLGARRWWALLTCVLVTLLATRTAARLGLRHLWLVPLALWIQPWVTQLGFTSITQIPFMLALTVGIERWTAARALNGRERGAALAWASLSFGLLPLIRHEGIALTALWAGYLLLITLLRRSGWVGLLAHLVIAALPMLIWNLLYQAVYGQWASSNLIDLRPTDLYGSGGWLHYFAPLVGSVGFAIVALALVGGLRLGMTRPIWRSPLLYALPALFYFIVHTLIYRFGLFASGGYVLFLLPMAPTFALLAAFGAEAIPDWVGRLGGRRARALKLAAVGLIFGAALFYNGAAALAVRPWPLQPNEIAAEEAKTWLLDRGYADTPVYSTHVWFFWVYEPVGRLIRAPGGSKLDPAQVAPGELVLWDRNYGDLNGIALADLSASDSGFRELARFQSGEMVLFVREG